jgi:hypothetical protein
MRDRGTPLLKRLATTVVALVAALGIGGVTSSAFATNTPASGPAFTTTNTAVDGFGHCRNGNEDVNCNIYDGKQYVWLNGGPSVAYAGDGYYFFAVLEPGGHSNPNDGGDQNLSWLFDSYTNRTFRVTNGIVTYLGTHDFHAGRIRVMPYADTTNPGGVYIIAICSTGLYGYEYPVDPRNCMYDAFNNEKVVTP